MDGLDLAALLGAGVAPTFAFFFGRLSSLLDRRASRKVNDDPEIVQDASILDGDLQPLRLHPEAVRRRESDLLRLAGALGAYERNPGLIREEDGELVENLGKLRHILEEVYGQRFTLRGERRERTGSRIEQEAERLTGYMVGAQGEHARNAEVRQKAGHVEAGGWMIGTYTDDLELGQDD